MSQSTLPLKVPIEMFTPRAQARVLGLLADLLDVQAAQVELDAVIGPDRSDVVEDLGDVAGCD